ncbi:hypothetical protein MLD38_026627 [Melastoma candidum]|uniref:Uncharacterized protein n=1 Tax=Melastoma candidum TaxID=119954 RepID=A0ACB9P2E4_9MYRT|nr:hypothetical protein MLD38_026627 [Melastoma candidum]
MLMETMKPEAVFKDIRRYYCEYCGVCRSKKALIVAHIESHHKDEIDVVKAQFGEEEGSKVNRCDECGATFRKPAYLKQHMQSHSVEVGRLPEKTGQGSLGHAVGFERPFRCSMDDCNASYRRKDHLTRHSIQHKGKLFVCAVGDCKKSFAYQGNMNRHVKEFHESGVSALPQEKDCEKQHVCSEDECRKVFKYASRLRKHEDSHSKLDSVEAFCSQCMKYFSNAGCLKEHMRVAHQYVRCPVCGLKKLKKNLMRHLRTHEEMSSDCESIKCNINGCKRSFSSKSNLHQHIKARHDETRPYICCFPDCGKAFAYKHVRDRHEKTGCHLYTEGDFLESDEQFRSQPRGGRKRKCPVVESFFRKRVTLSPEVVFMSD